MAARALPCAEICTWCGAEVEADDGFRAYEPAGDRRAVFCRLEHVVPWAIAGRPLGGGRVDRAARASTRRAERCSHCDAELGDVHVLLVRHRGEHRVADGFCSVDHMEEWAKAGGRWQ